jgi:hypothetical protein
MANAHDPTKERVTFAADSEMVDELVEIAKDWSEEEGRAVSVSEVIRTLLLDAANERNKILKQPLLHSDPTTKPGGNPNTRRGVKAA